MKLKHSPIRFDILTLFPEAFGDYFRQSILGKAQERNAIAIHIWNIRDYTTDKHRTADDVPYGGGAGMVMKAEPVLAALQDVLKKTARIPRADKKIILLSPAPKEFSQERAIRYANHRQIILICGRYEGIDERVTKFIDEKLSIGRYVLSGGELAAMVVVDAVSRMIPAVLGNAVSLAEESYAPAQSGPTLEYPQYTRPAVLNVVGKKLRVPAILLSGDHKKIAEWRQKHMKTLK